MNKLFISQNVLNRKVVTAELHYYGPYITYGNIFDPSNVLMGIQFSEPLLCDDQERYCNLSFTLYYASGNISAPMLATANINVDLTTGTSEDPPLFPTEVQGNADRFKFPVNVGSTFSLDPILYISSIENVKLTIYNPEKNTTYLAPNQVTRDKDVIAAILRGTINPKGCWGGQYRTSLYNSSTDTDLVTSTASFSFGTNSSVIFNAFELCYRNNFLSSLIRPSVDTYYTSKDTGAFSTTHDICTNYKCLSSDDYARNVLFEDEFWRPLFSTANTWYNDCGGTSDAGSVTTDDWGDYIVYSTDVESSTTKNSYQCNFCGYITQSYTTPTTPCPQCKNTDWTKI